MIASGDKERLIDTGMVEIVSDGRYEGRHDFQWRQEILDLRKKHVIIIIMIIIWGKNIIVQHQQVWLRFFKKTIRVEAHYRENLN